MKAMARLMDMTVADLDRLPVGAQASYVGQATLTLQKRPDGHWELVKVDPGIHIVSAGYVAGKFPEYD